MLEDAIDLVMALEHDATKIISAVSPLANCLLKNEGCEQFDVGEILQQVRCLLPDEERN